MKLPFNLEQKNVSHCRKWANSIEQLNGPSLASEPKAFIIPFNWNRFFFSFRPLLSLILYFFVCLLSSLNPMIDIFPIVGSKNLSVQSHAKAAPNHYQALHVIDSSLISLTEKVLGSSTCVPWCQRWHGICSLGDSSNYSATHL